MTTQNQSQHDAETNGISRSTTLDSEDSDDAESSREEQPITNWNELSIIERVGLNGAELSEKDLEAAFSQIALASRCDQFTLKQRLQAEEHARNLAEDNVQLELARGRETLETLKGLCLDSKRSKILQRLELSLDILGGTVERISNTAEVLGAVHQEARVSRAVGLLVAHVENLRRQHDRNMLELEDAKKTIQLQNSCRSAVNPNASPDPEESEGRKKNSQQNSGRRRVSVTLIPTQIQEKIKLDADKKALRGRSVSKDSFLSHSSPPLGSESCCPAGTKADGSLADSRPVDPEETLSGAPAAELLPPPAPGPEGRPSKHQGSRKLRDKNSPLDSLRHRHKGKAALSKKKADKDKKSATAYRRPSPSTCGSWWGRRPPARWVLRCRWALLLVYLLVLFCVVTLTCVLWKLHDEGNL
ncbi:uncharacterized protein LOC120829491 isoform X1 [Gasterosteus aculeatus]